VTVDTVAFYDNLLHGVMLKHLYNLFSGKRGSDLGHSHGYSGTLFAIHTLIFSCFRIEKEELGEVAEAHKPWLYAVHA